AVHAVNCKRGNKRIASLSSGFLVSGFVVDEATSPEFVVDEATRPDFVVDEATRPDRLARTWHEHGTNLIYYATGGLPCKWPPSVVHYKRLPLVIVNSTRASRILREGEYSCAKSTIPT
ncbi:MAG: hypothetical protein ACK5N9_13040, partial [Pirellula sp.]